MAIGLSRRTSLSVRLFILAAVWSLVALIAAGAYLVTNYRQGVERGHLAFVNVLLRNVIASVDQGEDGTLSGAPQTGDPRFLSLYSGWYWQVASQSDPGDIAMSPSLGGQRLELPPSADVPYDAEFKRRVEVPGPQDTMLTAVEQLVVLGEKGDAYSFVVASDRSTPRELVARFGRRLVIVFGILGIGLVAITVLQVRLGLAPLRQVRDELIEVREGKAERLRGEYPSDIVPLTQELNALIDSNAKIVERARMHVGNLAHAMKTPLSVVTNEARASRSALGRKVAEQAAIMRDQLDYYLDRAQMAARAGVIGVTTEVKPVAEAMDRTMGRIYTERAIAFRADVPPKLRFRGEKQDLEEMVGNLVDNAFKWARSQVRLTARRIEGTPVTLELVVEDDGPGLDEEERADAIKRGRRLDETTPGSGLGLSIVNELAETYDGSFELSRSPLGGLRATLRLPAA